jgi:hypothetical protein
MQGCERSAPELYDQAVAMSDEDRERLELRVRLIGSYVVMGLAAALMVFIALALLGAFGFV